jgi:hypothetical protein
MLSPLPLMSVGLDLPGKVRCVRRRIWTWETDRHDVAGSAFS